MSDERSNLNNMLGKKIFISLLLCGVLAVAKATKISTISVLFYSEVLNLQYHPNMVMDVHLSTKEQDMVQYYENMETADFHVLIEALQKQKSNFQLNDWLYYELMTAALDQIFENKSNLQKTLTSWFLLSKSGYDTRLTYLQNRAYLYVYTEDELFDVPMIEEDQRKFVNLTSLHKKRNKQSMLYMLNFVANKQGRAFSFSLQQFPSFQTQPLERELEFMNGNIYHQLKVQTDYTIVELMKKYPVIAEQQYLETPLSPLIQQSLLPQLQAKIKGKSDKDALKLLVAFTRSAFHYKEDKEYFGRSKPMIADEVFYYKYSDCEDRSALFYTLVRSLLDLPMLIVAFPDHLSIAVELEQSVGKAIPYQGKNYYLCDPTGPLNSNEIGGFPKGYERKPYEIIGHYDR